MQVQPSLSTFMSDSRARHVEDQAMRAEIYFAKFVAEHNLPFLVGDHFSPMRAEVVKVCRSLPFVMGGTIKLTRNTLPCWLDIGTAKFIMLNTRFLAMPVCNIATAEKLFDALDTVMEFHGTIWWVLLLIPKILWLFCAEPCSS